ncbi:dolichyl-phosphate beta-glucosyltransferase, putative [Talaromyces stipitatus ATCC 10500]|uniref:dolichyl-phosphate beta-glucosyltransferase n=1 Tax=Talaromyces stipitatus (strain ATCC 10500 / CBS 375.48 / QM 6759 / NRRL 1006) TaxID=441959 RepID=B8M9T7_TALSN|nr:dolichyl-phosphate beta-glucosyltransferase, putative [Talaromyces stipitatus ATCC 10500]EED18089.1 dolichyl-phosphate beta-glucosyltransferase, putative [Talaromyces stipitatus ATCC 10500]
MSEYITQVCMECVQVLSTVPPSVLLLSLAAGAVGVVALAYILLFAVAFRPRPPFPEEKTYRTLAEDGTPTQPQRLPCWQDSWEHQRQNISDKHAVLDIEKPELFMSVVVPAYNEEERLVGMLEETVEYLEHAYGTLAGQANEQAKVGKSKNDSVRQRKIGNGQVSDNDLSKGWEILLVSDGSTDRTEEVAFEFARDHQLSLHPRAHTGPWSPDEHEGVHIPPGSIRIVTLTQNRGKGGAVTHGMRHVRGKYVVFADADGASKFSDLGKLVSACQEAEDSEGRAVAVGSRAHMVGSEAVVKRSKLRNFLMHSFHLILWLLTPPATAKVKDTQCGFKLFSRASLPYIVPYMHSEGWIFDVEMLMLAEFAGIPVAEVAVGWREVKGSKLNVIWDSIGMAWGLFVLRAAWGMRVYRRT